MFSAASSDFSWLTYILIGFYYLLAIAICLVVFGIRRSFRRTMTTDLVTAIVTSLLFAPSLNYPNQWIAAPVVALIGALDKPLLGLVSVVVGSGVLLLLFRFKLRRSAGS